MGNICIFRKELRKEDKHSNKIKLDNLLDTEEEENLSKIEQKNENSFNDSKIVWKKKSKSIKKKFNFIKLLNNSTKYWRNDKIEKNEKNEKKYTYELKQPLIVWKNSIFTLEEFRSGKIIVKFIKKYKSSMSFEKESKYTNTYNNTNNA